MASRHTHTLATSNTEDRPNRFRFILGMRVDATSYQDSTARIMRWAAAGESRYVCEVPVNAVMESYDHPEFKTVINEADLVTPGGMPLVWMLRGLGCTKQPRVYGPELTLHVCEAAAQAGVPVGLYGGSEATLARLVQELTLRYPGLKIVYSHSPPFRKLTSVEETDILKAIRASGCRILFVGLGCPKQEQWMAHQRGNIPAVMLGVGAAFDFISGQKPRPFRWMQRMGLEWLFRWCTEPRRLFYRYAYHNPRFVALAGSEFIRTKLLGQERTATNNGDSGSPGESLKEEAPVLERSLSGKPVQLFIKRGFDIGIASLALIALAPLLALLWLLVRLSSPGPAIFRQTRVGFREAPFTMYKFRTMVAQPRQSVLDAQATAARNGILLKGKDDARVTPLGRWLRSTSLDELPQLFNVFKGDMSLVGPRPLLPFMLEPLPEFRRVRCLLRPGITGLWQISERHNNTSAAAMLPYDLEYVRRFSLLTDLRIIFRTPVAVLAGRGAV